MPTSNYPSGVSSYGMPVLPASYGKMYGVGGKGNTSTDPAASNQPGPGSQVFWVNNALNTASDVADHGIDPLTPFKSINFAVTRCIANNGDVIFVGPGHIEAIVAAASLTVGVNGVTIIGLGNQTDRATIAFSALTSATVLITANNVTMAGFLYTNAIDALVNGVVVSGTDCSIVDSEWRDGAATNTLIGWRTTAAAKRFSMINYRYYEDKTGGGTTKTEHIRIVGGDHHYFQDVNIVGTFSTGCINNITTLFTEALFKWISLNNLSAGPIVAMAVLTTSTFIVLDSTFGIVSGATGITAAHIGQIDMASSVCVPGGTPVIVGHA